MNNPFVKTVTTKKIVDAINVDGPDGCYMSFRQEPFHEDTFEMVIGAKFENRCAALFTKEGIKELIDILQEIHDTL
jgi:hypothetical protein